MEQEQMEWKRMEQEQVEQEQAEQEWVEQEWIEQEQEFIFRCLRPVEAGYHHDLCCMDGTWWFLLNQVTNWVANKLGEENVLQRNMYWFYGSPGIRKMSLAHSICASLHKQKNLAGAFFCQRDDLILSKPIHILLTFIHKLTVHFPPFQTIVAKHLCDNPKLTPELMEGSLFLELIGSLLSHPEHTLVFVINALNECGDAKTHPHLLKVLTNVATQASWLKIIITSRTEVDIKCFFGTLPQPSHISYDLATDWDASADLQDFAWSLFESVASEWHLNTPWPKELDFNRVISQANGLFIYIKTLVLALGHYEDPEESLQEALQDSAGTGLESLYITHILKIMPTLLPQ